MTNWFKFMTCGIYRLNFPDSKAFYIGKSINIEGRYVTHITRMKNGTNSKQLVDAYNLYGVPTMEILEVCDEEELDTFEEYHIIENNATTKGLNVISGHSVQPGLRGVEAPWCKHEEEVYVQILRLCASTTASTKEIAETCGVERGIVEGITGSHKHLWLRDKHPELYEKMLLNKTKRPRACKQIDELLVSSTGEVVHLTNMKQFCEEFNVDSSSLSKLLKGYAKSTKGWKKYEH